MATLSPAVHLEAARPAYLLRSVGVSVRAFWVARREVARIARELNAHNDKQLADMGITRADIPAIARGTFRR